MNLSFEYGTKELSFDVVYKKRKTLEIAVEPPDKIMVTAPLDASQEVIIEKVKSRASWIVQKLYSFKDIHYLKIKREFVNGEAFMYLGRNYSLEILLDRSIKKSEVKLFRGKFYITSNTKDEEVIHDAMEMWYREKTLIKVKEKVNYFKHFFNKKPTEIKVKEQKKRWASCTSRDELLFNWRCSMAPSPVLDYIVVHEMCHMYYPNHSKQFWDLVASVLPDYEIRKEWLKNYGVRLDL